MIWGVVGLVLLIIVIGLVVWLLVRSGSTNQNGRLNQPCGPNNACNVGLVCTPVSGTGAIGTLSVCKLASGAVCTASTECTNGLNCVNNVCSATLGRLGQACPCAPGFVCINNVCRAAAGQTCLTDVDCANGSCVNNVCTGLPMPIPIAPTGMTGDCWNTTYNNTYNCNTSKYDSHSGKSWDSSKYDTHSDKSSKWHPSYSGSKYSKSSSDSSSGEFYSCSDTNCSKTAYSVSPKSKSSYSSSDSSKDCKKSSTNSDTSCNTTNSHSNTHSNSHTTDHSKTHSKNHSTDHSNTHSNTHSNSHRYLKRGVYVSNQANQDKTLFTGIDQAIIDIAQQGNSTTNFHLLLDNGNMVNVNGITNTMMHTNKKMYRIIRFGTEIVGLDKKGNLYSRNAANSTNSYWAWEHLTNFPRNVMFMNSTNTYQNMEVLTYENKAYNYTATSNWKNGVPTSVRHQKDFRYYGEDPNRYIDINEYKQRGVTNDGMKYTHIRAAAFYNKLLGQQTPSQLVQVMAEDSFSHVRVIGNAAYFLYLQDC